MKIVVQILLAIVASSTGILNGRGRGVVDLRFGFGRGGGGGGELERRLVMVVEWAKKSSSISTTIAMLMTQFKDKPPSF